MQQLIDYLAGNPWILIAAVVGLVIWVAALGVVIRSDKFRRKWLWAFLTLFSFSYGWSVEPGLYAQVGVPLGALYVLGFWRLGPSPPPRTPEEVEAARNKAVRTGPPWRLTVLRVAYLAVTLATLIVGWLVVSGALMENMLRRGGENPQDFTDILAAMRVGQTVLMLAIAGVFVFLAARPYWWGKLLTAWAGLSWTGFGVIATLIIPGGLPLAWTVLACGLTTLAAAIACQIADPRFSGSYLRAEAA